MNCNNLVYLHNKNVMQIFFVIWQMYFVISGHEDTAAVRI